LARLFVTDIDGSMISSTREIPYVKPWVEKLVASGFTIVFNTAKTIDELLYIAGMLSLDLDRAVLIPEVGGAVCAKHPLPGYPLLEYRGLYCSVLSAASEARELLRGLEGVCRGLIVVSSAEPEILAEALNLPIREAELAAKRLFNEAVYAESSECLERVVDAAVKQGLEAVRHGKLVFLGRSVSKRRALEALLKAPWLKADLTIGVGDSALDDFLEITDYSFLITSEEHSWLRKWHIKAPYKPPYGWIWCVERVLLQR